MGRARGAGTNKAKAELIVIGLEELEPRIASWELELIERSLRGALRSMEPWRAERDGTTHASA